MSTANLVRGGKKSIPDQAEKALRHCAIQENYNIKLFSLGLGTAKNLVEIHKEAGIPI
jgi:hypothetical protein